MMKGGALQGLCLYLENGTLVTGNWGDSNRKGTWFKAPGIQLAKWYHVVLIVDNKAADKNRAFSFYLNGTEVAHGPGLKNGRGEGVVVGTSAGKSHTDPATPANPPIEEKQFVGLVDELEVYNSALDSTAVSILAGGRFSAGASAKP